MGGHLRVGFRNIRIRFRAFDRFQDPEVEYDIANVVLQQGPHFFAAVFLALVTETITSAFDNPVNFHVFD